MAIEIVSQNDCLVVDSRLIALELGIEHRALMQTVKKYLTEIQEFGTLAFEMREFKTAQGNTSKETYCYLNEEQATFLMTLSRNTSQVIACKRNLVKAFTQAKQIIKEVIPAQSGRIRELELELELTKAKTYYMDRRDAIRLIHGAEVLALLDGRPDIVIEKIEKVTETIICKNGRNVSFEGRSTAELGKELGFKSGKELERWLEKTGHSHLVCQGLRINQASYIPTENLKEVKQLFSKARNRQLLIGE
jgi:phage regulator Rha-like protein